MQHDHRLTVVTAIGIVTMMTFFSCAKTKIETVQEYYGNKPLPKPIKVIVHDFAVHPHDVSPNSAIGARIANLVTHTSKEEDAIKVGRAVATVLSEDLVQRLGSLGFNAERSSVVDTPPEKTLVIEGQFISIDEGNRLQRMVIGFGLGQTEVRTQVQVSLGTPAGRLMLEEFVSSAESSRKPGMGPMAGAGAVVSGIGTAAVLSGGVGVATEFDQTVEGDARRTSHEIIKKLSPLFARHGWIAEEQIVR